MNQKEYKAYLRLSKEQRPKDFFKYRNLAEKILGYTRNKNQVIHHLRDTEEQRQFNDQYYERWGIDFNNEMKYCILVTKEEHTRLHAISDETKEKIAKSVSIAKTKLTEEERKQNKQKIDNTYKENNKEKIRQYKQQYYQKHKDKIKQRTKQYKQNHLNEINQYNKTWKQQNPDKVRQYKQKHYNKKHSTSTTLENSSK